MRESIRFPEPEAERPRIIGKVRTDSGVKRSIEAIRLALALRDAADHGGDGMGIDRSAARRTARPGTSAWLYRLGVVACLGACAISGPPAVQAQSVPTNTPTSLEQLRAMVGLESEGVRPEAPVYAEPPRLFAVPDDIQLIAPPTEPVIERRGPTRLDQVAKLVDLLATLNGTSPPDIPPVLPVEALISEREIVPAVLEMPTPKPAPVEAVKPVAAVPPSPVQRVGKSVVPVRSVALRFAPWETRAGILCLMLVGTAFLAAVFLVSRQLGLTIRLRVSPLPRA